MNITRCLRHTILLLPFLGLVSTVLCFGQTNHAPNAGTVTRFENGIWFDGERFRPREMYSVNGVFQRSTGHPVDLTIDLELMFIIPPFADAHNHTLGFSEGLPERIDRLVDQGIFYGLDPNGIGVLVKSVREALQDQTAFDVRFAVCGLTSPGGHPTGMYEHLRRTNRVGELNKLTLEGQAYLSVDSLEQVDANWPRLMSHKPDFVKVFLECSSGSEICASDPHLRGKKGLDPKLVPAIVDRAKSAGLQVIAHVVTAADFGVAVRAGVAQIAHLPIDLLNTSDVHEAKARGVVVVTTTQGHGRSASRQNVDRLNLRALHDAGVQIALGKDNPAISSIDEALNINGLEVMSNVDLLNLSTFDTATAIFPNRKIGKLEDGYEASFLALRGNPLADFSAIRTVAWRFKGGRFVGKSSLKHIVRASHAIDRGIDRVSDGPAAGFWPLASEEQAKRQFNTGDWESAADAYIEAVAVNPLEAAYWQNLAYASHQLGHFDEAIAAWQNALDLGYLPPITMYNLASAHARLGQTEQALFWLGESLVSGFDNDTLLHDDSDLDQLRRDSRFATLVGACPADAEDRVVRWRHDLAQIGRRMEMQHYSLYANISKRRFTNALSRLANRIPELSDEEVAILLQQVIAMVGDAHTRVDLFGGISEQHSAPVRAGSVQLNLRSYPVDFYLFSDGLFVRDAADQFTDIRAARVRTIGGVSAEEALSRVGAICSVDNEMGRRFLAPLFLSIPEIVHTLGIVGDANRLPLGLELRDGEAVKFTLEPGEFHIQGGTLIRLAGRGNPLAAAPLPRYLKRPNTFYWHEFIPEHKLLYFQFNVVQNAREQNFDQYCKEMFSELTERGAEYLVIDLRLNGGGDNRLFSPLVQGLVKNDRINRSGHLFVIGGRRTLSAAMNLANKLRRDTNAIFVGEPTGSRPNFVGETAVITLPCTGIRVSCSSRYYQDSDPTDMRTWIAPRIVAELSSEDYFANRDPALEAIIDFVQGEQ